MTVPTEHAPGGDAGMRRPAEKISPPSTRRPMLSGRDIFSVISLFFIIATASFYAIMDAENPFAPKDPVRGPRGRDIITIDGNRNGNAVAFSHTGHLSHAAPGQKGCVMCHHLARPGKEPSSCSGCHRDMNGQTTFFGHDGHISLLAESGSCSACHRGDKSKKNIRPCGDCHEGYAKKIEDYRSAPGYRASLHGLCYRCHVREGKKTHMREYCAPCHVKKRASR